MFEKLKTKNINGKRHYVLPSGRPVPSMTTITGSLPNPKLDAWIAEMTEKYGPGCPEWIKIAAGIRGDAFHKLAEKYLQGIEAPTLKMDSKLLPYALFENVIDILDKIKDIKHQETTVFSEDLAVAGRLDCIARFDDSAGGGFNDLAVIDFKTSTKAKSEEDILNYFLQATGYSMCYEEMTGIVIPNIVIIVSCESGEKQVFIKDRTPYMDQLRQLAMKYHEEHPLE
jgi:hypothetical protein